MFFLHQIFRKVYVVAIPHSAKYSCPPVTYKNGVLLRVMLKDANITAVGIRRNTASSSPTDPAHSNLTFRDHMLEKINKAYSVLGIIKRNFIYMDEHTFFTSL